MDEPLLIATSNLQTGIGTTRGYWQYLTTGWKYYLPHGSARIEEAARFFRALEVDIVALTEVEGGSGRSRGVDQVALFAEHAGLPHRAFFPTLRIGSRVNQGNAICARYPVRPVDNHRLPGIGEPRYLSEAEVRIHGVPTRVFVTHVSLKIHIRSPQIDFIEAVVNGRTEPVVLAGDFNVSAEEELRILAESRLQQAASAPTFPSWKPGRALDHLFFSEHFRLVDCSSYDEPRFSDHLPLVAEVAFDAGGAAPAR